LATTPEGADIMDGVLVRAGNQTFRALFAIESDQTEHWRRLMSDLEPFDCWFDTWSETLIAISSPQANAPQVAEYLATRQSRGELEFESA
jgi:hypothetical protein